MGIYLFACVKICVSVCVCARERWRTKWRAGDRSMLIIFRGIRNRSTASTNTREPKKEQDNFCTLICTRYGCVQHKYFICIHNIPITIPIWFSLNFLSTTIFWSPFLFVMVHSCVSSFYSYLDSLTFFPFF